MRLFEDRLRDLLDTLDIQASVEHTVNSIGGADRLLEFISAYVLFNRDFAGGIANLAGAFQLRSDIFRDESVTPISISDRSSEIATSIFFAAVDEFWDRDTNRRISHRKIAQDFVSAVLSYFKISASDFDIKYSTDKFVFDVMEQVNRAYNRSGFEDEAALFYSLGFHIGSEFAGSVEYCVIDRFLREKYPALVRFLQGTTTVAGYNAYRWISLHIEVEVEHFQAAMSAVNQALRYYVGNRYLPNQLEDRVIEGIAQFKNVQRRFFSDFASAVKRSSKRHFALP